MFIWLLSFVALAQDVIVTGVAPKSLYDQPQAARLGRAMAAEVRRLGIEVVGPTTLPNRPLCAQDPDCVPSLFAAYPGRLAIVAENGPTSDGVSTVVVRFYGFEDRAPIEVRTQRISELDETELAIQMAILAREILSLLPGRGTPPVTQVPPIPASPPSGDATASEPASSASVSDEPEERGVGIEVFGGSILGDVDRVYDVYLAATSLKEVENGVAYQWDAPQNGTGFSVGLGLNVPMTPWMEGVVWAGIASGKQATSGGYAVVKGAEITQSIARTHDPIPHMMAMVEPKVRFVMPNGDFRAYGLVGLTVHTFNAIEVPADELVTYPGRAGGIGLGPTFGAGLMVDFLEDLAGFIEVPWTLLLLPEPFYQPLENADVPRRFEPTGQLLRVQVGALKRF